VRIAKPYITLLEGEASTSYSTRICMADAVIVMTYAERSVRCFDGRDSLRVSPQQH
jgi:hypothetical protein